MRLNLGANDRRVEGFISVDIAPPELCRSMSSLLDPATILFGPRGLGDRACQFSSSPASHRKLREGRIG